MGLRAKWIATQHASIFGVGSPYRDETAANNKMIIPSDVAHIRLCLPMGFTGRCYSNCGGFHGVFSHAEHNRVCVAGGMPLEGE